MERTAKSVLRDFANEAVALRREFEPHVFSPLGAQIPYAWAHLQHWYRDRYSAFEAARQAALSLTRDPALRSLYADTADGGRWLDEQIENLARRSMLFASSESEITPYFDYWYARLERELNRTESIALTIYEVWGIQPAWGKKFRPLIESAYGSSRIWIQQGRLAETADNLGAQLPPALLGQRWSNADALFIALDRRLKTNTKLVQGGGFLPEEMFTYTRAAQLVTGTPVRLGSWLSAEVSPFPRSDSRFFEQDDSRAPGGSRTTFDITPALHRRVRQVQKDLGRIQRASRRVGSPLTYALGKYDRIARLDGYWSDAVVDAVSVFESLFSTDDERNARIADRMTWLAGLSGESARTLLQRIRLLFRVRNDVIHAGKVGDEILAKALGALGCVVPQPTPQDRYPEGRYYQLWYNEGHPRLMQLLRWAIEFAIRTDGELSRPALRLIDDSIVLRASNREWVNRNRGLVPPV